MSDDWTTAPLIKIVRNGGMHIMACTQRGFWRRVTKTGLASTVWTTADIRTLDGDVTITALLDSDMYLHCGGDHG